MRCERHSSSLTERPVDVPKTKVRAIGCPMATGIVITICLAATTHGEYRDQGYPRDGDAARRSFARKLL